MVHALSEIRRTLKLNGILIDLRPVLDRWQIEVASIRESRETGRMQDFLVGLADDEAANQSVAYAAQNGWFTREQKDFFRSPTRGIHRKRWRNGLKRNGKVSSDWMRKQNRLRALHGPQQMRMHVCKLK